MKWGYLVMCIVSVVCMVGQISQSDFSAARDYMTQALLWLVLIYQEAKA